MEKINFENIDLSEVDVDDDLLAPVIKNDNDIQKFEPNPNIEITKQIEVVDDNE